MLSNHHQKTNHFANHSTNTKIKISLKLALAITLSCGVFVTGKTQAADAPLLQVESVQKILQSKKAQQQNVQWRPKDSWVNHLSHSEVKKMLGLKREKKQGLEFRKTRVDEKSKAQLSAEDFAEMKLNASLPEQMDWRNQNGQNWISPILNQGSCGSCVAFAAVGVLESQYRIATGFSNFNVKLSPQHLFSCGGGYCDYGWQPQSAAQYLQKSGVPDEACFPYMSGATGQDQSCQASCTDSKKRSVKISAFSTPNRMILDVNTVKRELQKGPLVTTMDVYADFLLYGEGIYRHVTGEMLGGHAVAIVGYNDIERYYIVRNSWGEDWGENGFVKISYDDDSGIGEETWGYALPGFSGGVSIESPSDYDYFSGKLVVRSKSTFGAADRLVGQVFDNKKKLISEINCSQKMACNELLDVATFADGRYEFEATAYNEKGEVLGKSERKFFYIANQVPKLTIAVTPKGATDLKKPLSGRIEFNIATSSSTVPMSTVQFYFKSLETGKVGKKTAGVVPNPLVMGWRTNSVPNGKYELWWKGQVLTNANGSGLDGSINIHSDASVESAHYQVQIQN